MTRQITVGFALILAFFLTHTSPALAQVIYPNTYQEGEIIVQYKEGFSPKLVVEQVVVRTKRNESILGKIQNAQENVTFTLQGKDTPEETLDTLKNIEVTFAASEAKPLPEDPQTYIYTFENVKTPEDVVEVTDAYAELPVKFVQPNFTYSLNAVTNDLDLGKQWGLRTTKTEDVWAFRKGSSLVKVAVLDSGIDKNHPDLTKNVVKSVPIAPGCINNGDGNGHGTHIAGIIGATTNNGTGIAGMNWDVSMYGYCVVGPTGIGSTLTIAQGIRQAVADGAHIINMSLGAPIEPGMDHVVEDALREAGANNVLVIAAAGNCGRMPPGNYPDNRECRWGGDADKYMPGSYRGVINVAAVGPADEHAPYSNAGASIFLSAPGGNPREGSRTCLTSGADCIYSTWDRFQACPSGGSPTGYCALTGTSMAAPYVTGLAALLKSVNINLIPGQVSSIMAETADDLGAPGRDPVFGHGRINTLKALQKAGGVVTTPVPTGSPRPTGGGAQCEQLKQIGDYNCDSRVSLADFESWRQDYMAGLATLREFELFRAAFTE